jgi:hypothetical protein
MKPFDFTKYVLNNPLLKESLDVPLDKLMGVRSGLAGVKLGKAIDPKSIKLHQEVIYDGELYKVITIDTDNGKAEIRKIKTEA